MRINKPVELAKYFLSDKPEWTEEKIKKEMNRKTELYVFLTKPVPIHVTYVTSWISYEGNLNFRKDIYLKDKIYFNTLCK
jgi:murein L,D-transpeptidase YcbB/YkuD